MKELFRRLRNYPGLAIEILLASLMINVLGLTSSIYSIVVMRRYLAVGLDSTLITLTVGALLAVLFEFILRYIRMNFTSYLSRQSDHELSEATFKVFSQSQYTQLTKVGPEQAREVLTGLTTVQQAYSPSNVAALFDAPFATIYLFVMFLVNPFLSAIASGVVLASLAIGLIVHRKMQKPAQDLAIESAKQNSNNSILVTAPDAVRQFNWLPILKEKWGKQQEKVEGARSAIQHDQNLAQQIGMSSAMLLSILVMGFGAREVIVGNMTVATLIGANILAARALSNINRCAQTFEVLARAKQQLRMLATFARLPLEKESGTTLNQLGGKLHLQDLSFMYQGQNTPIFESVTCSVKPGEVLAVKGGNGAGKTTMAKLLSGLLEPQRGEIRLEDVNLFQFQPFWLRSNIAYLPQEPVFFDGSLRENLTCLNPDVDDEQVLQMINKVGLTAMLTSNPEGLDMMIRGGGRHLSLGVRRRIAMCRALLGDGKVLILDEPTEGVDIEGCRAIAAIFNEMVKARATIVVMSSDPFIVNGATWVLDLDQKPVPQLSSGQSLREKKTSADVKSNKGTQLKERNE